MIIAAATRRFLLDVARTALAEALGRRDLMRDVVPPPDDPLIRSPTRVFVSWHFGERLVGCIGTLEPARTLEEGVRRYAVHAGLYDPRTAPAQPHELPQMRCEISVLSDPQRLDPPGLDAIERALRPGVDGVIIEVDKKRAVFLPVVWEKIPGPRAFLLALCRKGKIDPERDGPAVVAWTFQAERFEDPPLAN